VVSQDYVVYISPTHVIVGNDALMSCAIPAFVGDLVSVVGWVDGQANEYLAASNGKHGSCSAKNRS